MPKNNWEDKDLFEANKKKLIALFIDNFKKFGEGVKREVINAGPQN